MVLFWLKIRKMNLEHGRFTELSNQDDPFCYLKRDFCPFEWRSGINEDISRNPSRYVKIEPHQRGDGSGFHWIVAPSSEFPAVAQTRQYGEGSLIVKVTQGAEAILDVWTMDEAVETNVPKFDCVFVLDSERVIATKVLEPGCVLRGIYDYTVVLIPFISENGKRCLVLTSEADLRAFNPATLRVLLKRVQRTGEQ
jgi:hypothetical protein